MKFPEQIETERLLLKRPFPPTFELAQKLYTIVDESRETLREWLPWVDQTRSAEDEYSHFLVDWCQKHWEEGKGFPYLIHEKKTQGVIGAIDFMKFSEPNKTGEIGYWLGDSAVGFGYMQEALKAVEKTAFELGINRIEIKNDTMNDRSVHVTQKAGYHLDGIARQDAWDAYHNRFRDTNIWSKLKSEWLERQKG